MMLGVRESKVTQEEASLSRCNSTLATKEHNGAGTITSGVIMRVHL